MLYKTQVYCVAFLFYFISSAALKKKKQQIKSLNGFRRMNIIFLVLGIGLQVFVKVATPIFCGRSSFLCSEAYIDR